MQSIRLAVVKWGMEQAPMHSAVHMVLYVVIRVVMESILVANPLIFAVL